MILGLELDATFVQGSAAFISAILIFVGSVWLLLAMVLGGRLAYFVTASVTLAFTLIMGVVWSINPLGPVGQMPAWNPVAIGESPDAVEFGAIGSYPDSPWFAADEEDDAETAKAAELEGDAADYLEAAITDGKIDSFEEAGDAQPAEDGTRLLEQDGTEYGAVTFEAIEGAEGGPAVAVLEYDPGNPLGPARMITAGTGLLLVLHLFGLSRAERRAKEERVAP